MLDCLKDIHDLVAEIDLVDPANVPEPEEEVAEGDEVIGVLPENLRKILAVHRESVLELLGDSDCPLHGPDLNERIASATPEELLALQKHKLLHLRHNLITNIMRQAVREVFPVLALPSAGASIRKGWNVVIKRFRDDRERIFDRMIREEVE